MSLGMSNSGTARAEAMPMIIHGRICTNRTVFKVAMLLFRDVSPIHIPNQLKANKLPTGTSSPARDIVRGSKNLDCPITGAGPEVAE
jgi:hypothetical protein